MSHTQFQNATQAVATNQKPDYIWLKSFFIRTDTYSIDSIIRKIITDPGVEITIFPSAGHFCRNFLNFIFKNIFCSNLAGCGKLNLTCPLLHV